MRKGGVESQGCIFGLFSIEAGRCKCAFLPSQPRRGQLQRRCCREITQETERQALTAGPKGTQNLLWFLKWEPRVPQQAAAGQGRPSTVLLALQGLDVASAHRGHGRLSEGVGDLHNLCQTSEDGVRLRALETTHQGRAALRQKYGNSSKGSHQE